MAASCSNFQSSLNIRLPAHILKVEHVLPAGLKQRFQIYSYGRLLPSPLKPGDHLRQGFESDDIYPTYNGRLPTVDFRQNNILYPSFFCLNRHREHTPYRPKLAVQSQLTQDEGFWNS